MLRYEFTLNIFRVTSGTKQASLKQHKFNEAVLWAQESLKLHTHTMNGMF